MFWFHGGMHAIGHLVPLVTWVGISRVAPSSCCIVVYKVKCLVDGCNMVYIGNTQQHLKTRMQQHFGDVRRLVEKGEKSDSFTKHFAKHFDPDNPNNLKEQDPDHPNGTKPMAPSPTNLRKITSCNLLWKGNPLSAVKTFRTKNCALCAMERYEILKFSTFKTDETINSCNEIYGACRHKPKFHRYATAKGTDESPRGRKGPAERNQPQRNGMSGQKHSGSFDRDCHKLEF